MYTSIGTVRIAPHPPTSPTTIPIMIIEKKERIIDVQSVYMYFCKSHVRSWAECTHEVRSTITPSLKMMSIGMLRIASCPAIAGSLSTLCFMMRAWSPISFERPSSIGHIIWHGPHHGAQKSTSTRPFEVSRAKFASVEVRTDIKRKDNQIRKIGGSVMQDTILEI